MTMPHKICPHCGQPAVLAMTQCRRCGFVYGSDTPAAPAGSAADPNAREIPRARQAAPQRKSSLGPLALLIVLGIGVFVVGAAYRVWRHAFLRHAAFSARGLPGGSAVNAAPADAASLPGKLSLFVESESTQEMPVLTFRNFAIGTMTLTLRDRYGHVYRASSADEQVATLQIPAGDYSVSIDSDNPRIRPNWGDATFRKFKAYHADFVVGHTDERVHLGD
jgi:rubredoxin